MNTSTLSTRSAALRRCAVPIAIGLLCLALSLGGDTWREIARYERASLEAGELWRLLTAHLVHLGPGHTLLNVAALAILVFLLDDVLDGPDWSIVMLVSALAIDGGVHFLSPDIDWYVGLSGVLHGCMAAGGLKLAFARMPLGLLLLGATAAKLVWEQFAGAMPFSDVYAGGPVVVDAHLYGALGGAAAGAVVAVVRGRTSRPV